MKILMIVEVPDVETRDEAEAKLDEFRHVNADNEQGIVLYQATYKDVTKFGLACPDHSYRHGFVVAFDGDLE
jgi:hypothetical protein